jgi:hypothetical protein
VNNTKKNRLPLYIGIPVILLLIFLRFGLYFLKSDGFSGLSMLLPILLLFILFALCTAAFFAAWVYQDCKKWGDDPVLWAIVVFIATPFIGLLIYFLRRSEIKAKCPACGHRISVKAKYCEECGAHIENKEDNGVMVKQETHHLKFIIAGIISMVLMLVCLTGFIVSAATGNGVNTDVTSNDRVWNLGVINMNSNTYLNGVWKLDFRSASDGFVEEQDMMVEDADTQMLYADISCETVPEDATLVLWLVQGEVVKSVDVTNLSEPLEYPLNDFENGEIHVRLQINGVEDTVSEIYVK